MSKRAKIVVFALLLAYCAGYLGVREAHLIVHRSGYYTSPEGGVKTASHFVHVAHPENPDSSLSSPIAQLALATLFMPHIVSEQLYWYIAEPLNEEWPYEVRETTTPTTERDVSNIALE